MVLSECAELAVRLFFEMVKLLFAPQALFSGDVMAFFSTLLRTAVWFFLFALVKVTIKNKFLSNMLILVPLGLIKLAALMLGLGFLSTIIKTLMLVPVAGLSAIAWGVIMLLDDDVHFLVKLLALPGVMLFGFLAALMPNSFVADVAFAVSMSAISNLVALVMIIFLLVLVFTPLKFLCSLVSKGMVMLG